MKGIEKIINDEVDKFINENPGNENGTISGLSIRMKYVIDNTEKVAKIITDIANEYLENNSDINKDELTEIAKNAISRFMTSSVN